MAVTVQLPRNQYTANGSQTAFSYTFEITANSDIAVYVGGTLKTLTTDYTVSGAGVGTGGSVTFVTAPPNGAIITLRRAMSLQRSVDFQTSGSFYASSVNEDSDRHTLAEQQIQEQLNRAITIGPGDAYQGETLSITANATTRAGYLLGFDGSGNASLYQNILGSPISLTGLDMLRVKSDASGYELRTPAQVITDLNALTPSNTATLSNKSFDTASNPFAINGHSVTDVTGSGATAVLNASPTITGTANIAGIALGGTTSSYPMIKRNSAAVNFRLADDSADANITAGAGTFSGTIQATGALAFASSGRITAQSDGVFTLFNSALSDFGRLQFGGTTSSFPAFKRNGAVLELRLADDSGYAQLNAGYINVTSGNIVQEGGNYVITSGGSLYSSGNLYFGAAGTGVKAALTNPSGSVFAFEVESNGQYAFSSDSTPYGTIDVAIARNGANVLEVNTGTAGTYASLKVKTQTSGDATNYAATTAFVTSAISAAGGGNVSNAGTPATGQIAQWTSSTTIEGVTALPSTITATTQTTGDSSTYIATTAFTQTAATNAATTIAATAAATAIAPYIAMGQVMKASLFCGL